jgi:hypothetical protein
VAASIGGPLHLMQVWNMTQVRENRRREPSGTSPSAF